MTAVIVPPAAAAAIATCWQRSAGNGASLYASADAFLAFVRQALGRDIRSVHQRLHVGPSANHDAGAVAADESQRQHERDDGMFRAPVDAADASPASTAAANQRNHDVASMEGSQVQQEEAGGPSRCQEVDDVPRRPDEGNGIGALSRLESRPGVYHVVLEGTDISYDVDASGVALVRTAMRWHDPRHIRA